MKLKLYEVNLFSPHQELHFQEDSKAYILCEKKFVIRDFVVDKIIPSGYKDVLLYFIGTILAHTNQNDLVYFRGKSVMEDKEEFFDFFRYNQGVFSLRSCMYHPHPKFIDKFEKTLSFMEFMDFVISPEIFDDIYTKLGILNYLISRKVFDFEAALNSSLELEDKRLYRFLFNLQK